MLFRVSQRPQFFDVTFGESLLSGVVTFKISRYFASYGNTRERERLGKPSLIYAMQGADTTNQF